MPLDRYAQVTHVGEIGLTQLTGLVILRKENLPGRSLQGTPHLDPSLQGAQFAVLKATRMLPLQMLEQRLGLQPRIDSEHAFQHRPHFLEGIVRYARRAAGWWRYLRAVFSSMPALAAGIFALV